ncbi:hypothetical protein ABID82_004250 [Methylobacterium sp. PvP062]|nr:hypothetical protein [Methylobacterium sp. PvP105]KZC01414.1 hypothetical protein AU375_02338 [Methylobacterium radiotolerans]MBP2504117.1 hypothetical protein [Methylobacterium sp. PvP109]MCX7333093.1 hypothetical protein [Hyphomicrobiales bacterium]
MELDPHIDVDSAAPPKLGRGARGKYRMTPHEGEMCRRLVYALRCELKARHRTNEQIRVAIGDSEVRAKHTRLDVSSIR